MLLRNARQLEGHALEASDGPIGRVKDFYFDDAHWRIRYCVVETGEWLQSRRVLISPTTMAPYDPELEAFPVNLTTAQVRQSPDVGMEALVSRQQEQALHHYYNLPVYWGGLFGDSALMPGLIPTTLAGNPEEAVVTESERPVQTKADPYLRSVNDTIGYHVDATDGSIGHVEDLLIHGEDWTIRYLVVDTRNWWPGKKVVLAPDWIRDVNWEKSRVAVDLTRADIEASPVYDPASPWSDYGTRLEAHYRSRRSGAWR